MVHTRDHLDPFQPKLFRLDLDPRGRYQPERPGSRSSFNLLEITNQSGKNGPA